MWELFHSNFIFGNLLQRRCDLCTEALCTRGLNSIMVSGIPVISIHRALPVCTAYPPVRMKSPLHRIKAGRFSMGIVHNNGPSSFVTSF